MYFVQTYIITKIAYIPFIRNATILHKNHWLFSSQDPHQDIKVLLARYESNPDSESQLKLLLPQITSSFGGNKSVIETIEELKSHQSSTDSNGMLNIILYSLFKLKMF
jgi:hypothetical protein